MADNLKFGMSITLSETDVNKSSRFLDTAVEHSPITYEKGKITISGETTDKQIAGDVNFCCIVLKEGKPFSYKIGADTTSQEFVNTRVICYDAATANVYVSNPDTDPIQIEFVSAKF